ncbi:ABC transporter permease [Reyranella sp.]|jgi:peptide/nickel transport system permease protein|uniref:ABC transporter permease n=1 Tax=Reyranella sp. TaxID=1929291 RepID=UPI000BD19AF9|nr:ABC transporter permease [Reyranella sp.]OYY43815.1 MAG: ABC transporter permease [Rhodospirillales bacterium 35-66-84]OYZ94643.1 MAG: ABC transporter permease [Rhodospirillales bacterium 24-66-33]OZB25462.1 MAG: ABC transporter permease [Rhodospirillales bacterium 39-66-50]HQS16620.1 ABC transporter permease [Reyranella sp.]HQT13632.1 ABC transporter permease [Reyranella sp.]
MLAFILRRLLQSIAVLLTVGLVSFSLFRYVGDPINSMVGQDTPASEREALRERLGLNDAAPIQFLRFIGNAAQGKFGLSYRTSEPVGRMILERLPATLELSFCAAVFALFVGVPMGVYTGLYPKHWSSRLMQAVSLIGISLPTFVIGILLILVFAVWLHWLPSFGRGETVMLFGWWPTNFLTIKGLQALILPSITLGLFQLTLLMRLVRSEMLEVMRTDYIKFARARGLTNRAINFGHALKNTLVPVITVTGLQLGALIAFAIVTETVFAWPGVGQLFIQSVQFSDIPVMAAYLMLIGLLFVLINLTVDLLYFVVDPRLRSQGGAARVAGH